mmetsp:Transcript_3869/g.5653  ORF Transcript_3869/g.5653 Transcript_3869/m.5653 type:complete len:204 (+) Transcript_3869:1087-1698(+)
MLGSNEEAHVWGLKATLEQFHHSSILQLEITPKGRLTNTAGSIYTAQKADLVIRFCRVPLTETFNVDITSIAETFARSDQGIFSGVLIVETHVACWYVCWRIGGATIAILGGVIGIFTISLSQIQKATIRTSCILHNLLNFLLTQNPIFHPIMSLNHHHTHTSHPQKIPHRQGMRRRRMFAISQQATRSGMTRKCLGSWHHPE